MRVLEEAGLLHTDKQEGIITIQLKEEAGLAILVGAVIVGKQFLGRKLALTMWVMGSSCEHFLQNLSPS